MTGQETNFQSLVICTSPRSGSTLLCKLLAATGKAGSPDSHFHEPSLDKWLKSYDLTAEQFSGDMERLRAIFQAAKERGSNGTGVFGLRMQRKSFDFFSRQLKVLHPELPTDRARIEAAFGKTLFIHLTRKDKIAQAVSFVKATQSGLWHKAADGTELERLSEPQDPVYDTELIASHFRQMNAYEAEWARWFSAERIDPLQITYDELSSDPEAALIRIFDALGFEHEAARGIAPPVAKLSDATNREWIDRFAMELREGNV
ncbi:Stf0 family sulfotransferase [Roseibium sp. SCP14]|uniref:Stf0 family sulfotransferase n=1 Tax=Roseibium sp. SCP14 TaxID=3141375 RepID=UPI003335A90A